MAQRKRKSNSRKVTYIEALESRIAPAAFTVTTLHDSGPGSLRQAITDANAAVGADTIDFQHGLHGTIKLSSDLPAITDAVTISGPGATKLIVNGHLHQIIAIAATNADITISGVTLSGGQAANGGGVSVDDAGGTVTLSKATVSGNRSIGSGEGAYAGQGGGISVAAGTVKLQNAKVSGNKAGTIFTNTIYLPKGGTKTTTSFIISGAGGGIDVGATGTVDVQSSVISGNSAADGGGIHNAGALTVEQASKILKNKVRSVFYGSPATGGGISNLAGGTVTVTDSKITGNQAIGAKGSKADQYTGVTPGGAAQGGGIFNPANGTVSLVNSIVSGNKVIGGKGGKGAPGDPGDYAYHGRGGKGGVGGTGGVGGAATGGGIFNAGTFTVDKSMITGNSALGGAGGAGGTGGRGGQGASASPAYKDPYTHHVITPARPPGPGGFGGPGGPGGPGGVATGGGIYDSTNSDVSTSIVSGNKQINGKTGARGKTGPMGRAGSSGGGNPYGGGIYA